MSEEVFTGKTLEKALSDGIFDDGRSDLRSFDALVRKSEKKDHVGVGVAGCESFVDIPTELIVKAKKVGYVSCGGHGHPQMRITLKPSDDPITQVLFQLLAQVNRPVVSSMFLPGFPPNEAPDHGPVTPGIGSQARFQEHGLPFEMGVSIGSGSAFGPNLSATQNFVISPVCRYQAYPCGFTRDPFRIKWCWVYVCRYGGYHGFDVVAQ